MKIKNIIGVVCIGILLVLAAGLVYLNYGECGKTESGWSCRFKLGGAVGIYKKECERQGGEWKCYGLCSNSYDHYCDLPLGDGGKECANSDECNGLCIVDLGYAENNCVRDEADGGNTYKCENAKGACSKYNLRECNHYQELNNGVVNVNLVLCD
ncbi:MAG: hypothetical protein MUD10_02350 [Candidatus Pacebacteria bacterium]|nr:hypothetical protein [Candidatus Paceibacterota bacterium]